ncbi:MAG: hypothetical protein PHF84_08160, partial [bacterium]|nr:hypothetical protein [bacterium]
KIFNRNGVDVFQIKLNENLVSQPLVCKSRNKQPFFLQATIENNIYAFDFRKRRNIWALRMEDRIMEMKEEETDYDGNSEIFVLTRNGKLYILDSRNGAMLTLFDLLHDPEEKVVSNLSLSDMDQDDNLELILATDKGNMYKYKLMVLNKKFILKNLFRMKK